MNCAFFPKSDHNLCSLITHATNTGVSHFLIVEDFNMPHINWNTLSVTISVLTGWFGFKQLSPMYIRDDVIKQASN